MQLASPAFPALITALFLAPALCGVIALLPRKAHALMPPHVTSTEPPHEGVLHGKVYVIHGYSLSYMGDDELDVLDGEGHSIPFDKDLESEWVGEGDMPGARQEKCTLRLTFEDLVPGASYTVEILGDVYLFKAE